MSAGGFTFYAPPHCPVDGVMVGLGSAGGVEFTCLSVRDGDVTAEILLTADELTDLIDQLTILRNAMRVEALSSVGQWF